VTLTFGGDAAELHAQRARDEELVRERGQVEGLSDTIQRLSTETDELR
jgi:hypothetical protein